ncbi:MAG: SPOR domain-containing protein [Gemmobacter sp.]|nr:SPOR domain-containing protein [Gemmobacter sp.]
MRLKYFPVAIVASFVFVSVGHAQGRAPAELPPAGYAGQQYVDSKGCLFIRAGFGGQVNWVARIDRARNPICGQTPSTAVMAAAKRDLAVPVAEAPQPRIAAAAPVAVATAPRPAAPRGTVPTASYAPPPVTYGAPTPLQPVAAPPRAAAQMAAPRIALSPAPEPTVMTAPQAAVAPVQGATVGIAVSRTAGCPDHAPVGQVYPLHRGGSLLVCASGPHRLTGLRPGDIERLAEARATAHATPVQRSQPDLMAPPPGYKPAWRDDRLNPQRAQGTAQGHQQMLQVWTDKPPQQLRHPAYAQPRKGAASSKALPVARQEGARFVQVGSFGVPENAARAVARLQSLGMPVQVSRAQIKGKPVQVVRAGPFGTEGQAASALQAARGAGFGDAILRR